jgi:glutamyl-tRNA synthetase
MPLRGRLAPSPTGALHAGNVRTFMLAWLSARTAGGSIVLRIEDIDTARCKPGYIEQMIDDLRWLGFDWDEGPDESGPHAPYLQSRRLDRYHAALERLIADGRAYPCVCSRAELAGIASAPHGPGGPSYTGRCRDRFADAAAARAITGREPAWRFDSRACPRIPWRDGFATGAMPDLVDDVVLWRADGVPAYHLAVVVDDLAMGITEVVRGDDLADSTPRQLALIRALGGQTPEYRHVPLVLDDAGRRLAKRDGATRIATLRGAGVRPEQVIGLLARSAGLLPRPVPATLRELAGTFSWASVSHEPGTIPEASLSELASDGV